MGVLIFINAILFLLLRLVSILRFSFVIFISALRYIYYIAITVPTF
ncbi:MAG: hypothetical protein ACJAYV_001872 [Oleispira sp.]|jgi:hypothetical protein